jgi:dUTPase
MLFTKINESKTHNLPSRVNTFAAGYDFYLPETVSIPPNTIKIINTNIKLNLKHQKNRRKRLILLKEKSSVFELLLCGGGVIDSDFTGEIKVRLLNINKEKPIILNKNMAFIQAIPLWFWEDKLEPPPLFNIERGNKGFGECTKEVENAQNSHENEEKENGRNEREEVVSRCCCAPCNVLSSALRYMNEYICIGFIYPKQCHCK